jgi:hypothetical protein
VLVHAPITQVLLQARPVLFAQEGEKTANCRGEANHGFGWVATVELQRGADLFMSSPLGIGSPSVFCYPCASGWVPVGVGMGVSASAGGAVAAARNIICTAAAAHLKAITATAQADDEPTALKAQKAVLFQQMANLSIVLWVERDVIPSNLPVCAYTSNTAQLGRPLCSERLP